jgi:hypothetical protein
MAHERRLRAGMPLVEFVELITEGSVGAVATIAALIQRGETPYIEVLDEFGIYGERLHVLARYIAGNDPAVFTALLYAAVHNLQGMSPEVLNTAIDAVRSGQPHGIRVTAVATEAMIHQLNSL